jgi:ABC-type antimicrobial peptide transport system permease subunit
MFFVYLRRELRRRMRQVIFISLGLAVGIGLVITVTAASAGVGQAQGKVLHSLYGVGTDITVTKAPAANSSGPFGGFRRLAADAASAVTVHLNAQVTLAAVALAVALALAGGLIAGGFGGWRAARLRPADALARVE